MKIKRLWQWLLGVSGVLASIFVIVDQGRRLGGWVGDAAGGVTEWAASVYDGIGPLQRRAAQAAAEAYHGNPVCIASVTAVDLDRDGYATDLIARYIDLASLAETDPPLSCEQYAAGQAEWLQHERFLVAKGEGFGHAVLDSFTAFNEVKVVNGLVVGSYLQTDFPTSTIYGYQDGKLEELRAFDHMLEYGTADDEEVEAFDLIETPGGLRVRSPEGLFDILWDATGGRYAVSHLDWQAAIANNQFVLYVRRPEGALEIDAKLMLNDRVVAGSRDARGGVAIHVAPLDRIVFDPACLVKDGFKPIDNALGAVALDPAAQQHVFECVLYPGAIVTVRVEKG